VDDNNVLELAELGPDHRAADLEHADAASGGITTSPRTKAGSSAAAFLLGFVSHVVYSALILT
jgi:hypothetical protein